MGRSRKKKPFNPLAIFERVSDIHEFNWIRNANRQSPNDPFGHFKVYAFKCDCNDPMYDEWESADRLAAQGEYCENPTCELKPPVLPSKGPILSATPCYYTEGAYFGMFQCPTCKTSWQSACAYANKYQACKMCKTHVYSFDMSDQPIWNSWSSGGSRPPHNQELCEKCKNSVKPCYRKRVKGRGNWDRYYLNSLSGGGGPAPPKPPKTKNRGKKKRQPVVQNPVAASGDCQNPTAIKVHPNGPTSTSGDRVLKLKSNAGTHSAAAGKSVPCGVGHPEQLVQKKKSRRNRRRKKVQASDATGVGAPSVDMRAVLQKLCEMNVK